MQGITAMGNAAPLIKWLREKPHWCCTVCSLQQALCHTCLWGGDRVCQSRGSICSRPLCMNGTENWERVHTADAKAAPVGGAEGGPLRDLLAKPAVVAYYELSMEFARDTGSF